MNLQDFVNEMTSRSHDFEPDEGGFQIVAWNGKERVPLVLDGIDYEKKVIVLTTEPLTAYSEASPDYSRSARSQYAETQRRYNVDERTHIETLHDSVEYMRDVLARKPLPRIKGYRTPQNTMTFDE